MANTTVVLEPRFCGPPNSGNGGIAAGLVADAIDGPAEVTLRAPPPLGVPLTLSGAGHEAVLHCGEHLIASGVAKDLPAQCLAPPSPDRPDFDAALAAQSGYSGFATHNFPGCFVCGPARASGDGLRIFAAPCGAGVAAAWQPGPQLSDAGGSIEPRFLHAALDCPSYFALGDPSLVALLGRMHVALFARPRCDERLIIEAWPVSRDGRKHRSAAVLRRDDGTLLAGALNTWIQIDGAVPDPPVPSVL